MNEPEPPTLEALSDLADELLEQSIEIRRMWGELAEVLGADVTAGFVPPAGAEAGSAGSPATPAATMRLVALDMLLAGRTRRQIHSYLRETFRGEDVQPVVDQVFADFDA